MKDLTIFVSSCDKYADLWKPFFYCFKKFYKYDNEPIILVSESKTFSDEQLNIECYPQYDSKQRVPWGELVLKHLDKVKTKYILFLLDDFFIRQPVDMDTIKMALDAMEKDNSILTFSLSMVEDEKNKKSEFAHFYQRPQKGKYKLNTQPALWRVSDLKQLILPSDNPWDWEDYGSRRVWFSSKKCYCLDSYYSVINVGYKFSGLWSVYRGKWVLEDVKPFFDSIGCEVDYSERGIYDYVTYKQDSLFVKIQRIPQTIRMNIDNMNKRRVNNKLGKEYAKVNG